MTKNCSTCICKEGACYPSTTIFDKDKTCKSYMPDYEGYIADLEREIAELKKGCEETQGLLDKQIEATYKLDKENAKLKEQLDFIRDERNYFQEKCEDIELNYYCDRKGGCKVQELETENNKLLDVINNQDVKIAELESNFRICEKNADTYYDQLTKAKELLEEVQGYIENNDDVLYDKIEQFIKEIEK